MRGGSCSGSLPTVVLAEEDLDATPRDFGLICVVPGVGIAKLDAVVHSSMCGTLRVEIAVRTPAITDDRSAEFNPDIYDGRQCVGGPVRYGNKKCSTGPSFNTAERPLTLNSVSPNVLSPTELAVVNLDGLVRITDHFRAALHEHQPNMPQSAKVRQLKRYSFWIC